jgi:hypothetical protein
MRRPRRALLLAVPMALLVGACSASSPAPYSGPVPHPSGSDLVVRIEWTGGFVPYESLFTSLPRFTLLGDGRVIIEGPTIAIYPGPALPNLQVRRLTEEGIQSVLSRIAETGLFGESASWDGAAQFIADANDTVFTVRTDGREVVVDVYALGFLSDPVSDSPDISAAERDAHSRLLRLENDLLSLETWIPADDWADDGWQAYAADSLRLLVANIDDRPPNPDDLGSEPMAWPSTTAPDAFGTAMDVHEVRCGVVTGAEADAWYAALEQANQLTPWSHDGHRYSVTARPLLPDEPLDCGLPEA